MLQKHMQSVGREITYLGQRVLLGEVLERLQLGCIQGKALKLKLLQECFVVRGQVSDVFSVEDQILKLKNVIDNS